VRAGCHERTRHDIDDKEPTRNYGQVAATIFTDATSRVRALLALVPDVAAGAGVDDVAPAAPVLVAPPAAPDALLMDAAFPVTVMRCPT